MPIGFDRGDLGGSSRTTTATRPRSETTRSFSSDLLQSIAERRIVWTRWITASDERTCPECAPLEGTLWREGEGPEPPLHGNCRCVRVTAFVEVGSR
jgi:SPP1 gp7 family putative phage head morphogenesis protein